MPKKKNNAFWTFVMDYKRDNKIESQEEAKGRADAVWRTMTDAEKKNYTSKRGSNQTLGEVELRCNAEVQFQQTMTEEILSELTMAKKYNNLSRYRFYIIHVNSFCYQTEWKKHYPCEIGISSFTLRDGVTTNDVYHALIYPGPLPNGYSSTARLVSEKSHQIPWEYDEMDNTKKIFEEVVDFLLEKSGGSKLPILYTKKTDLELVKNVLDIWCEDYNPRINFTVYSVQTLFSLLHKNVTMNPPFSSASVTLYEMDKDLHCYASGINCEYHESADVQMYCSRSIAIRIGYTICQSCCPGLDIDLIPGQHVPFDMQPNKKEVKTIPSKFQEESNSSVRVDSSDEDTISSFGRSATLEEDTASSINFPEYDNSSVSSARTIILNKNKHTSGNGNLSNDLTSRTGSSGFSRKPAVLPSTVNDNFGMLSGSPESVGRRTGASPSLRGRGGAVPKGKGRGHPFRK